VAEAFCSFHGLEIQTIQRRSSIGKTPTIKRQARELDSDVEFVLDADTVLESANYLERAVQELYKAVGIASACGTILTLRDHDRCAIEDGESVREFRQASRWPARPTGGGWLRRIAVGITNLYREVLYLFLQRFIYHGQMVFFGTISNPVGCAVAYRRKYVQALFDLVGPELGDDLTNSEDIFIGLAMLNEGYRNIQLTDVCARTVEPHPRRLPRQVYLWSSSFLQCCYYFDALLRSPLKVHRRLRSRRRRSRFPGTASSLRSLVPVPAYAGGSGRPARAATSSPRALSNETRREIVAPAAHADEPQSSSSAWTVPRKRDRRRVGEPYRQGFGRDRTVKYGRPVGWVLLSAAIEKVFFPTVLAIMLILGNWHGLMLTVGFETLISLTVLAMVMKGQRFEYVLKGLVVAPIRYALLASDLVTIGRFASDLWITNNRKWRK
jgi:hypothetical protein